MNELEFQKQLKDAVIKEGGFAWKTSQPMVAGLPDITLILDGKTTFVECKVKVLKKEPRIGQKIKIGCTPLQRATMQKIHMAGASAGLITLLDLPLTKYCHVTQDLQQAYAVWGRSDFIRKTRGEPWPIREILNQMQERPNGICSHGRN